MNLIKFNINNKDYFINVDEWEKYNNFFKNKTLYNMKKFNPNSKQAIEIVRRLCEKYPELVCKSNNTTDKFTGECCTQYSIKIVKNVEGCKLFRTLYINDKDYKLHIDIYIQGALEINPQHHFVIPVNKDEYDELATIFDYAINKAIINSMVELGFTNNAIEEMFKDEEKTE